MTCGIPTKTSRRCELTAGRTGNQAGVQSPGNQGWLGLVGLGWTLEYLKVLVYGRGQGHWNGRLAKIICGVCRRPGYYQHKQRNQAMPELRKKLII